MRVLHVICAMMCGGSELMLVDLIREQTRLGHEVGLLITNNYMDEAILGQLPEQVKVVKTRRPGGSRNPWWIMKYNWQVRRFRADIVHFHTSAAIDMLVGMGSTPKVFTAHCVDVKLRKPGRCEAVYAISDAVNADLTGRYGIEPVTVLNGIDFGHIKDRGTATGGGDRLRIVTVGRLDHRVKGQHLLIESVRHLARRGVDVEVDIVGEGASRGFLEAQIRAHGVGDRVRLLGVRRRDYIYSHLADYDLFVLPSLEEGFGLSLVEAMGAGVPVLAGDILGPLEIIGDNEFGTLFKAGDAHDLADKIERIATSREHYGRLARKARAHAVESYGIGSTARAYVEHYKRLLQAAKR